MNHRAYHQSNNKSHLYKKNVQTFSSLSPISFANCIICLLKERKTLICFALFPLLLLSCLLQKLQWKIRTELNLCSNVWFFSLVFVRFVADRSYFAFYSIWNATFTTHQPCTSNKVEVLFYCACSTATAVKEQKEVIDFLPGEGGFINILTEWVLSIAACTILASFLFIHWTPILYLSRAFHLFHSTHYSTHSPYRFVCEFS